jgi:hypothetical protein
MKTINKILNTGLLILLVSAIMASCKKDSFDLFSNPSKNALPKVEMVSVSMIDDETLLLVGNVSSEGKDEVDVAGFCFSEGPVPHMLENQVLAGSGKGEFTAEISGIEPDCTFYFRCFATSELGYTYGDKIIKFTIPNPQPPVVPCSLPEGKLLDANGFNRTITYVEKGPDASWNGMYYGVRAGCSEFELRLEFQKQIRNGVYTTVSNPDLVEFDSKAVYVVIKYDLDSYTIAAGSKVYVTKNANGSYKVEFCDLKYHMFSSDFLLKGSIPVP